MSFPKLLIITALAFLPAIESIEISKTGWTEASEFSKSYHHRGGGGGGYYKLESARTYCNSKGGKVWQPDSEEEAAFISSLDGIKSNYIWIGLTKDSSGSFRWIANHLSSYANWRQGEPGSEDVHVRVFNKEWTGTTSDTLSGVLCERDATVSKINDLEAKVDMGNELLAAISSRLTKLEATVTLQPLRMASLAEKQYCNAVIDFEPVDSIVLPG